jgi:hypothetical protein
VITTAVTRAGRCIVITTAVNKSVPVCALPGEAHLNLLLLLQLVNCRLLTAMRALMAYMHAYWYKTLYTHLSEPCLQLLMTAAAHCEGSLSVKEPST